MELTTVAQTKMDEEDFNQLMTRKRKEMDKISNRFGAPNKKNSTIKIYSKPKRITGARMWGFCFTIKKEEVEDILDDEDALIEYLANLGDGFKRLGLKYSFAVIESYQANSEHYLLKGRIHFGESRLIYKTVMGLLPNATIHRIPEVEFFSFDISSKITDLIIIGTVSPRHLTTLKERVYIDPFVASKETIARYFAEFFAGYFDYCN